MHISKVISNSFGEKREIKTLESGVNLEIGERVSSILKKICNKKYIFLGRTENMGMGGRRGSYSADNTGPELRNHVEISPSPCAHILSAGFTTRQNMALK